MAEVEQQDPMVISFGQRVGQWLRACFGDVIANAPVERSERLLEESLELVQSQGLTREAAHQLVDYVYSRPVGDPPQEVGGVMVTLGALCYAAGLDMHACGETELARIQLPDVMARIREKQRSKPAFSPLPGVYPERQPFLGSEPMHWNKGFERHCTSCNRTFMDPATLANCECGKEIKSETEIL